MTTFLPGDVTNEMLQARLAAEKKTSRLRVVADGQSHKVLRQWTGGFAVESGVVPPLRGMVELFERNRLLSTCLIVASEEEAGEMRYEFKRSTAVRDRAPLDFQQEEDAPVALLADAQRAADPDYTGL